MIEKLRWDSEFFGYPVGQVKLSGIISDEIIPSMTDFNDYKLVYVFSDNLLPSRFNDFLVAKRVHFYKNLSGIKNDVVVTPFDSNKDSYEELIDLAYQSGVLSRFRVDVNFKNNEYHRLYKQWINKSITDSESHILVTRFEKHLTGFHTVEFMDSGIARFGLIAVDKNSRGKGLGSLLLQMSENEVVDAGKYDVQVTTHLENKPAIDHLQKNGYQKMSSSFVYHFWNT